MSPTETSRPPKEARAPEGGPHNVNTRGGSRTPNAPMIGWEPGATCPQRRQVPNGDPRSLSQRERNRCPQRRHSRTVLQQEWMAPNGGQGPMTGMLTTRSRDLDTRSKPLPKPQREIGTARSRLRVTYDHVEYKGGLSPCAERHPLGADLDR